MDDLKPWLWKYSTPLLSKSAENQGGWINAICHAPTVRKARQHAGIAMRPDCPACGSQAWLSGLIAASSRM
jgi:hypothetical protein